MRTRVNPPSSRSPEALPRLPARTVCCWFPLAAVLGALALTGPSTGQDIGLLSLDLRASSGGLSLCDSPGEVRVALVAQNPDRLSVGGFQLFLGFPAGAFQITDFVPADVDGLLAVNGPPPFGPGFSDCSQAQADPWDDGQGVDMVSVIASAFGEGASGVLDAETIELGEFVFQTSPGVAPGTYGFDIPDGACPPILGQLVGFFDGDGEILPVQFVRTHLDVEIRRDPRVEGLACEVAGDPPRVLLRWEPPPEGLVDGYRIYRNGEVLASFVPPFSRQLEDERGSACEALEYQVSVLRGGEEASCRAACMVSEGEGSADFIRGDVNGDGRINILDPILSVRFIFGRAELTCLDAGDYDDSGTIGLADAIQTLRFTFVEGVVPPAPPFPEPGADPTTDDDLCCQ